MAASDGDRHAMKAARSVLTRKGIDLTRADVRVQRGVCYIRGYIGVNPGVVIANLETEMEQAAHVIRQKPDIRSVILEVTYGK
jgi:hypothetical protein